MTMKFGSQDNINVVVQNVLQYLEPFRHVAWLTSVTDKTDG